MTIIDKKQNHRKRKKTVFWFSQPWRYPTFRLLSEIGLRDKACPCCLLLESVVSFYRVSFHANNCYITCIGAIRLHSRFRGPVPTLRRCGFSVPVTPAAELARCWAGAGVCSGRDRRRSLVTSAAKADRSTANASATRSQSSSSPSSRADNSRVRTVEIRRHRRAALRCGRIWNRPDTGLRDRTSFSLDIQTNLPLTGDKVGVGGWNCKIVFLGGTSYLLVRTLLLQDVSFSCNAERHGQTDRQTDRQHHYTNSRLKPVKTRFIN